MASGDIESIVNLFAIDSEWVLIPTGEMYAGKDKITEIIAGSMKMDFQFIDSFYNIDGTKLCIEFLHNMIVNDNWKTRFPFEKTGSWYEVPIESCLDL